MGIKIAAIYKNGAFVVDEGFELIPDTLYWSENAKVWIEMDARFDEALPDTSPLHEAQREFAIAFANGGWDEARVRAGCRLAWNAAAAAAIDLMNIKGWAYESPGDLESFLKTLDEEEAEENRKSAGSERGGAYGSMRWFTWFSVIEVFLSRANGEENGYMPYILDDVRDFEWRLQCADRLISDLAAISASIRSS